MEELQPAKLIPSSDRVPKRFERGTPPFELLAGVRGGIDWLADLTGAPGDRRARLVAAFTAIDTRLQGLLDQLVAGLSAIDGVRLIGSPRRRTSTLAFLVDGFRPQAVSPRLGQQRIAVWDGDNSAHELIRRYGLTDTGGAVRASIVLYTSAAEIDRLVEAVTTLAAEGNTNRRPRPP